MEEDEAIANADTLNSILDGIWDSSKPFDDLIKHFAHTMSYLLKEGNATEAVLVAFWLRWLQAVRFQEEPRRAPIWKLSSGFLSILNSLDPDKPVVLRLWQSYWTAIKRGLAGEIHAPEDIVGIGCSSGFESIADDQPVFGD